MYRTFLSSAALAGLALVVSPALATPITINLDSSFASAPISFGFNGTTFSLSPGASFGGSVFTYTATGDFFFPAAVTTSSSGAVRTIFGQPSTDFPDRGSGILTYGPDNTFGQFPTQTTIPYSNGDNYLGLQATLNGQNYYGFAFTTDTTLNSFGFETTPGVPFTIDTNVAAVPEPASWAMMIGGFGLVGGALRRRKNMNARFSRARR